MTQLDEFDRTLTRWFDAEPRPAATAEVLARALQSTGARRPRPTSRRSSPSCCQSRWGSWVGPAISR